MYVHFRSGGAGNSIPLRFYYNTGIAGCRNFGSRGGNCKIIFLTCTTIADIMKHVISGGKTAVFTGNRRFFAGIYTETGDEMEKTIRFLRILRWFVPVPGVFLCWWTLPAFGRVPAVLMGIIASVWLWIILRDGVSMLIGQGIVREIGRTIRRYGNVDHLIEIRRIRSGVIARVYLIGQSASIEPVRRSLTECLDHSGLREYLWVMQVTQMRSRSDLKKTRMLLNRELLDALRERDTK